MIGNFREGINTATKKAENREAFSFSRWTVKMDDSNL
jgi:hypothetical protein